MSWYLEIGIGMQPAQNHQTPVADSVTTSDRREEGNTSVKRQAPSFRQIALKSAIALLVLAIPSAVFAQAKTLSIANEGIADLPSLDPHLTGNANSRVFTNLVFNGLARIDGNGKAVPDLATWTVSPDGRTYTFTIQPGARFSTGAPVTSADVVWSLNRALSPATASKGGFGIVYLGIIQGARDYNSGATTAIEGVKAVDDTTLTIELTSAAAYFPSTLYGSWAAIMEEASGEDFVGAGPFQMANWAHGQSITVKSNPYYFGGVAQLDEVTVKFYANPDTAYNAYLTGAVDVMGAVHFPSSKVPEASQRSDFSSNAILGLTYLVPNTRIAPFDDPTVRLAFSYAIDRKALASLLGGMVSPTSDIVPHGLVCHSGDPAAPSYNPETAARLLSEAGYPAGAGLPALTYTYGANSPDQDRIAAALQQMWQQALGVHVNLNAMEMGSYLEVLDARTFQLAMIEWGASTDPRSFLSLQLRSDSGGNNAGYNNERFDELTRAADVETVVETRCAMYQEAEAIALGEAAWFPLYNPTVNVLIRPSVTGLGLGPLGLYADNWAKVGRGE